MAEFEGKSTVFFEFSKFWAHP